MNEFEFISRLLAPLAAGYPGGLDLRDDAALLQIPGERMLVVSKDALVEGVHFTGSETPQQIAQKSLRVNLSDLAAMGADPLCYFMALIITEAQRRDEWLEAFASGLAGVQRDFSFFLAGGDTTGGGDRLCLTVSALGTLPEGQELRRSGACSGDIIYVSSTIGDAALGLRLERGVLSCAPVADEEFLRSRYRLPQPRIALGKALRGIASAAIDISDGMIADLGHICESSGTGAVIRADSIPLSPAADRLLKQHPDLWRHIISGGDDYELCFTAAPAQRTRIEEIAQDLQIPVTAVGEMVATPGIVMLDENNREIPLPAHCGYTHF